MTLLETLAIDLPIIQAPMAGVSSPALAAAVSNAGALVRSASARSMRRARTG
jgi:nitronate monooxygenase